ncbi:hypothetical protein ACLIA0_07460 [Bacillaceae bacterium W0354]
MGFFALIYVVVFFISIFISLKFEWSKEGKDERGQHILSTSYRIALPFLPLGWLALELVNDYLYAFSFEQYKRAIWFLVTGIFVIHATCITVLRNRL